MCIHPLSNPESEININSIQQKKEMSAVHTCTCPLQDVYVPHLPVPSCGSLFIKKYVCTPSPESNLSDAKNQKDSEMTAVAAGLQESSTNCPATICTYPQVWVLSHCKACAHTPCPTLSKINIDSIQQKKEMSAVHTCSLQDVYGPYLPVPGCGSFSHQKACAYTPCPTLSEKNINSIQQNREMSAVHTCPLQDVYGPYFPAAGPSVIKKHVHTPPVQWRV